MPRSAIAPQPKHTMKTTIILLITSIALANSAGATEKLTIAPAHGLPDYTKLTAVVGTAERFFIQTFAVGDFNKDGRLDLVVQTGSNSPPWLPFGAQTFLQETNGTFTKGEEKILPHTGWTWEFVTRDFNEDGNLDIITEDSNNDMVMMLGNGDGTFQSPSFLGLSAAGYFAVAHLDGDNHLDLVAGKLDGKVGVYAGSGDGTFSLRATLNTLIRATLIPRYGETMIGDLNGDGKLDVAVASVLNNSTSQPGNLDVFLGNGDGTFQDVVRTSGVAVRRAALGDFNGDGILDYVGDRGAPQQLEIWLGAGNGHFTMSKVYSLPLSLYSFAWGIRVGDINYDDIQDVIVAGQNEGIPAAPLSIFLGNGEGTFQPGILFTQANGGLPINLGPQLVDFNEDGFLDILSMDWLSYDTVNEPEAVSIALSHGVKRDPRLGALINVERLAGPAPASLALEVSTNLSAWTNLATNAFPSTNWSVTDTNGGPGQRFYRTRRPSP